MIPRQVQQQHPTVHHWEPGHEIPQKTQKKDTDPVQGDLPEWLGDFTENLVEEGGASIKRCTRRFFSQLRSGTSFKSGITEAQFLYWLPRKTKIARTARKPRLQGFFAGGELGIQYLEQRSLVIYSITADHKVLNEGREYRHNHRYSIVVQDLATQWIPSSPCKTKTSQETGVYESCLSRRPSRKAFSRTIRWIFANLVKIYHGTIVLPHLIDLRRLGLPKEQCAESKKERLQYCCNLARMKNGGLILCNAVAVYEMFKTSWKMGKHLVRGDSENHLKSPIIPFASNGLNIFRPLPKISQGSTNLVRGSCQA